MQLPAQVVDQCGALPDQPLAVIAELADLPRRSDRDGRPGACRCLHGSRPARSPARRSGSDLPGSRTPRRAAPVSRRRDPDHPFAARDQEPLQAPGHVPAVLDCPHPCLVTLARPGQHAAQPGIASRHRPGRDLAGRSAPATAAHVCVRLCASTPITIMYRRPFSWLNTDEADRRRTLLSRGGCHAPIKSRQRSSGGDRRQNARKSATSDKRGQSQPAASPRTYRNQPSQSRPINTEPARS